VVAPPSPIIVRVVGPPTESATLGDVVLQALGIAGVLTLIAVVLGLVLGALFIMMRIRRPLNTFNGETSGELSLHLTE
jgi:ABC-type amino acid transport system permease subunit